MGYYAPLCSSAPYCKALELFSVCELFEELLTKFALN